jgi:excisionase family DNA binding protein
MTQQAQNHRSQTNSVFLNVHEAAEFLRVAQATLYGWVHCRKIPHRKHGSKLVFCREELSAWSKSHEISALENAEIHFEKRYGATSYPAKPAKPAKSSLKTEQKIAEATTPIKRGRHGHSKK